MQTVKNRASRTGSRRRDLASSLRPAHGVGEGPLEQIEAARRLAGEVGVTVGKLDRAVGDEASLALAVTHRLARQGPKDADDLGTPGAWRLQDLSRWRMAVSRYAQGLEEQAALVAEGAVQAAAPEAVASSRLVERRTLETFGAEHLERRLSTSSSSNSRGLAMLG